MRTLPSTTYSGVTIFFSNPSRFDIRENKLLSTYAARELVSSCLDVGSADLRDLSHGTDLLPSTTHVLALGDAAFRFLNPDYRAASIHQIRGNIFTFKECRGICTYLPQDCCDIKNYEHKFNSQDSEEDEDDTSEVDSTNKNKGRTSRKNFRFWFQKDLHKLFHPLSSDLNYNTRWLTSPEEIVSILTSHKDDQLYLDIETDYARNLFVVGFNFGNDRTVYVFPFITPEYNWHFTNNANAKILRSLSSALCKNEVIAHNSAFDLTVLFVKYGVMFGRRIYDTMLATHRCFPEVERSLGHTISLWTELPYHKDSHVVVPHNHQQYEQLIQYNARDVWSMRICRAAIDSYATRVPGLAASIKQANDSRYPYLINTFMGIRFDEALKSKILAVNERKLKFIYRCITLLTGSHLPLPTSNKQCVDYFHVLLGYKVVGRTPIGNPTLKEDKLQELALSLKRRSIENPVIQLCIEYRRLVKQSGSLGFNKWEMKI